jgi:hypothetical protein
MFPIEMERADRQFSKRTAQICVYRGETRETFPSLYIRRTKQAAPENMGSPGNSHRGIAASRSASLTFSWIVEEASQIRDPPIASFKGDQPKVNDATPTSWRFVKVFIALP